MNEIDNRAKILLAAMNANISKGDPKSDNIKGLTEVSSVISSLITTIESLQKEIKKLSTCQECGGLGINEMCHDPYYALPCACTVDWMSEATKLSGQVQSQKEEIERLREREFNHYPMEILDLETRIFKLQDEANTQEGQIESLQKEVESLKEQLKPKHPLTRAFENLAKHTTPEKTIDEIADEIISRIDRR